MRRTRPACVEHREELVGAAARPEPASASGTPVRPPRVSTGVPRSATSTGSDHAASYAARSVGDERAASLGDEAEQRLGDRPAVDARRPLVAQELERRDEPRLDEQRRPRRAAGRRARTSRAPSRIVITGSSIRRQATCAAGIATPLAREPQRRLDERRPRKPSVRAPERVEPGRDARARRTTTRRPRSARAPRRTGRGGAPSARRLPDGTATKQSRFRDARRLPRRSGSRARRRGGRSSPSPRRRRRATAATAASAAVPPAARISAPASAVAGCPAATAAATHRRRRRAASAGCRAARSRRAGSRSGSRPRRRRRPRTCAGRSARARPILLVAVGDVEHEAAGRGSDHGRRRSIAYVPAKPASTACVELDRLAAGDASRRAPRSNARILELVERLRAATARASGRRTTAPRSGTTRKRSTGSRRRSRGWPQTSTPPTRSPNRPSP